MIIQGKFTSLLHKLLQVLPYIKYGNEVTFDQNSLAYGLLYNLILRSIFCWFEEENVKKYCTASVLKHNFFLFCDEPLVLVVP